MFMQVNVKAYSGQDTSLDPTPYEPAHAGKPVGQLMIPLWLHREDPADQAKLANLRHRSFHFGRTPNATDVQPWIVGTDGGLEYAADPRRISAAPQLAYGQSDGGFTGYSAMEIWEIQSSAGWSHPVHVHFEEGIILDRAGKAPPEWEKWARKDVYRVGGDTESSGSVQMVIHFREFAGIYVEHCHNPQHEDSMLRWDIECLGQFQVMATPLPTWDGVQYAPSVGVPTFRTGDGVGPK